MYTTSAHERKATLELCWDSVPSILDTGSNLLDKLLGNMGCTC